MRTDSPLILWLDSLLTHLMSGKLIPRKEAQGLAKDQTLKAKDQTLEAKDQTL